MFGNSMKKNNVIFIRMLFLLIFLLLFITFFSLYLAKSSNLVLYKFVLNIIIIVTTLSSVFVFTNTVIIIQLLNGRNISSLLRKWVQFSLRFIYGNTINLSRMLSLDKNRIRSVFCELNNRLILSSHIHVKAEEILILLPHCLQLSSCVHKITNNNINNCKRCGKCDIDKLISLKEKYGTKLFVATGGTLARKIIKEMKPKAIITVACERDLSSGIVDVKNIPIIGVLNERPQGPCVNTRVNLKKIEETIRYFIGEGE